MILKYTELFDISSILFCLGEKHDEFDCAFELELLIVIPFIVKYSPFSYEDLEKGI